MVRVRLVHTTRIPPHQSAVIMVHADRVPDSGQLLMEPSRRLRKRTGLIMDTALVEPTMHGFAQVLLTNDNGFTQKIVKGTQLGHASSAEVIDCGSTCTEESTIPDMKLPCGQPASGLHAPVVAKVMSQERIQERREKLLALLPEEGAELSPEERQTLHLQLAEKHEAFALEEGERGETNLVEMTIDTGDAPAKKQPPRRMPFAVRQEVAHQLKDMQEKGVIQPSSSPWASPIVLVRKKDGSLRFCIDYRGLNSVTKADTFPLPRIDDLLDQLGKSKYFSTVDMASGYWQIPVHRNSREKTAFTTHRGLFEFRVMPFGLRNAPAVFQRLMECVLQGLNPEDGPDFVSAYIDDVLVFSATFEEHVRHLSLVLQALIEAGLKLKLSKCRFIRKEVDYLGHIITTEGLKPNPAQTAAVANFPVPTNLKEVRQFVGLASYYRRFIRGFAKIAHSLHALTKKGVTFEWTEECQEAFQALKERLTTAPVLCYPDFGKAFILETDASIRGLGAVLAQVHEDGKAHPIAYASRSLSPSEKNYGISELETLAVVWACSHFQAYLYGHDVSVFTDHSAVKAILETPSSSGKHARWWSKVYGSGIRTLSIIYKSGKSNTNADALSRNPTLPSPPEALIDTEVQVAVVSATKTPELLQTDPGSSVHSDLDAEQRQDPVLADMIAYLEENKLPAEEKRARKIAAQALHMTLLDGILYYIDPKQDGRKRVVVPKHLQDQIMKENHSGIMAGHFSGQKLYNCLAKHWWWEGMYADTHHYCRNCPQCTISTGSGRQLKPPLQPIPVSRPFQIIGVDIMDLPKTSRGNQHVVVFQDFLTKWPLVFPTPDQKALRLTRLLAEEVVPMFGVPEALLSDRGPNLLSHLMGDVCKLLGIKKLNTTAYHPQCDGMVERFNRTLKTMLRKHAATYGNQWDTYLPGVLWAYRNTPHESTGEKPSFLLFGVDCRTPTEAALLPTHPLQPVDVCDYREQLILQLSSARQLAVESIGKAQKRYKAQYDKRAAPADYHIGDWVIVRFPQEESGHLRKLSRPWHGPYRIVNRADPDVTVMKVYFPQHSTIQVHQTRVQPCPPDWPNGFYWYGDKRHGAGWPPKWTKSLHSKEKTARSRTNAPRADQTLTAANPQPKADHRYNLRARN